MPKKVMICGTAFLAEKQENALLPAFKYFIFNVLKLRKAANKLPFSGHAKDFFNAALTVEGQNLREKAWDNKFHASTLRPKIASSTLLQYMRIATEP